MKPESARCLARLPENGDIRSKQPVFFDFQTKHNTTCLSNNTIPESFNLKKSYSMTYICFLIYIFEIETCFEDI